MADCYDVVTSEREMSGECPSCLGHERYTREQEARTDATIARLQGALEAARGVIRAVAVWDLFGEHGNLVNAARYAEEKAARALRPPEVDPTSTPAKKESPGAPIGEARPTCQSWCGKDGNGAPASASGWRRGDAIALLFCTDACMDARRPLAPPDTGVRPWLRPADEVAVEAIAPYMRELDTALAVSLASSFTDAIERDRASREPGRDQTLEEAAGLLRRFQGLFDPAEADDEKDGASWYTLTDDVDAFLAGMKSRPKESLGVEAVTPSSGTPAREMTPGQREWLMQYERYFLGLISYDELHAAHSTPPDSDRLRPKESPPREPGKCATWCGGPSSSLPRPWPEYWTRADDEERDLRHFCSPACRDARRPSNPGDSDPNQSHLGTTEPNRWHVGRLCTIGMNEGLCSACLHPWHEPADYPPCESTSGKPHPSGTTGSSKP